MHSRLNLIDMQDVNHCINCVSKSKDYNAIIRQWKRKSNLNFVDMLNTKQVMRISSEDVSIAHRLVQFTKSADIDDIEE